ncbi:MAG: mandelate racemase/muconate lactonizing enzyme family protein [Caldilineaceae bacterium]
MRIVSVESTIVNVPYRRREVSSVVARDGVTDVLVRVTTDDGLVGWGEACNGADVVSVRQALTAMTPFVLGRNPWNREAMQAEIFHHGLWQHRAMTGNYAWAGIDMALWDICAKAANQPLYRFFGGLRRQQVNYFYYLARGSAEDLQAQCASGLAAGYTDFYLKVGLDFADDLAMVAAVREALGSAPCLRLDANGSWSIPQALKSMAILAAYDIDFVEQPVREYPLVQMAEFRARSTVSVAANEGLWSEADAYARITGRVADVYCFSPYWVGSLAAFHRLAHVAHWQGLQVCKHTHGELGIAAAACHHLLLTLPNLVTGNQQTAQHMESDVLTAPLPIADGPLWGVPSGIGLGIEVSEDAVAEGHARYASEGQYLPYQAEMLGKEEMG